MSKKKKTLWKQRLTEALNSEGEEIEKQAEPFRTELSQEKKDEMYQNIMQEIQAMNAAAGTEKKNAETGSGTSGEKDSGKRRVWRRPLKVAGVLAAVVVLVFGMSLTSEGNRMYWLGKWQSLFG